MPGNCFFSYNDSYENDDPLEISLDNIKYANDVSHLKNEHIDVESMLQRIEQEYMVIKPESNYDYINYDVYLDNEANYRDKNRKKSNIKPVIDDDDFAE